VVNFHLLCSRSFSLSLSRFSRSLSLPLSVSVSLARSLRAQLISGSKVWFWGDIDYQAKRGDATLETTLGQSGGILRGCPLVGGAICPNVVSRVGPPRQACPRSCLTPQSAPSAPASAPPSLPPSLPAPEVVPQQQLRRATLCANGRRGPARPPASSVLRDGGVGARTSSDLARRVSHRRARCASRRSDASAELMIVEVGVANARRFSSKVSAADHLAKGCGVHKHTQHARQS